MYIVQLYKEDWTILRMLGCRAVALPNTEQIVYMHMYLCYVHVYMSLDHVILRYLNLTAVIESFIGMCEIRTGHMDI